MVSWSPVSGLGVLMHFVTVLSCTLAPLFLAPFLCHFRDNPSLRDLSGQTMTGGRSEEGALSAGTDYSVYAYTFKGDNFN